MSLRAPCRRTNLGKRRKRRTRRRVRGRGRRRGSAGALLLPPCSPSLPEEGHREPDPPPVPLLLPGGASSCLLLLRCRLLQLRHGRRGPRRPAAGAARGRGLCPSATPATGLRAGRRSLLEQRHSRSRCCSLRSPRSLGSRSIGPGALGGSRGPYSATLDRETASTAIESEEAALKKRGGLPSKFSRRKKTE